MKIVSIQEVDITMTGTSQTATITAVGNLAQSVVWGSWQVSGLSGNTGADMVEVDMWLSNTTTVNLQRNGSTGTIDATVFVIEFDSSVTVQKGSFSIANGTLVENISLTSLVVGNSFSVVYKRETEDAGFTRDSNPSTRFVSNHITTSTNLKLEREDSTSAVDGHWWVAEDTSLDVTVEEVDHVSSAVEINQTMAASRTVVVADTFVVGSMHSPEEEWQDEAGCSARLLNTTQVAVGGAYSTAEVEVAVLQIAEDSALTVQQKQLASQSGTSGTTSITSTDLTKSIVVPVMRSGMLACTTSSAGFIGDRYIQLSFNSATEVAWARGTGSNVMKYFDFQIIEFEQAISLTREQEGFRFRNDDGNESSATWDGVQDVANIDKAKETPFRLRGLTNYTGNPDAESLEWEYKRSDEGDGEYRSI